jgi:calmodulin
MFACNQPKFTRCGDLAKFKFSGDGTIDFPKFLSMMNKRMTVSDTTADILDLFRAFDRHGDGYIRADELRMVMKDLGHVLNMDDVNEMIGEADRQRDGKIKYEGETKSRVLLSFTLYIHVL